MSSAQDGLLKEVSDTCKRYEQWTGCGGCLQWVLVPVCLGPPVLLVVVALTCTDDPSFRRVLLSVCAASLVKAMQFIPEPRGK